VGFWKRNDVSALTGKPMNLPDIHHPFARTNSQTIRQRAALLKELQPGTSSIAEICCGDCKAQHDIYCAELGIKHFRGLDLSPDVVALNRSRKIPCEYGDALDAKIMRSFLDFDAVFFGPPLSADCDGHHLIAFHDVIPGYAAFSRLLLQELKYQGLLVLIGPRTTSIGDAQWIDHQVRIVRPDYRLRMMHSSYSSVTGKGEPTERRLKYVELWYQPGAGVEWEMRASTG
jgi:hypothetical protein